MSVTGKVQGDSLKSAVTGWLQGASPILNGISVFHSRPGAFAERRFQTLELFMNSPAMQGLNLNTPAYVKNARLVALSLIHI